MKLLPLTHPSRSASGFALVITLMMVVMIAVLAVALLNNASLDRLTSAAYDERYEAELAAQSGLEAAKQALFAVSGNSTTPQTQNDSFVVVSENSTNVPYFFIGAANPTSAAANAYQTPKIQYFALYSGGPTPSPSPIAAGVAPTPPPPPTVNPIASQTFGANTLYYPKLLPSPAPHALWQPNIRTQWQYVPNPTGTKQYRYTYWIEDLAAYVDANVAGNTDNNGAHIRSLGYDPKEVALFTLYDPALQSDNGTTHAEALVDNHPLQLTPSTTRLGTTQNSADDNVSQSYLSANLQTDLEQDVIPYGLGYKNEGRLKTNLNQLIADVTGTPQVRTADAAIDGPVPSASPAASPIIPTITDNLPNFANKRQGGLSSSTEGYLETLAANILDYGDTD